MAAKYDALTVNTFGCYIMVFWEKICT